MASMDHGGPNRAIAVSDPNRPTSRATTTTKMQAPETLLCFFALLTVDTSCVSKALSQKLAELDPQRHYFTAKIVCKLRPQVQLRPVLYLV